MKYICMVLAVFCVVLAYLLYDSYRNVERLTKDNALQRMEAAIMESLSPSDARLTIRLYCHTIRINEHFGEHFKWGIEVAGMKYEIGENYIVFRNDISGVSKSWFPKREKHEKGGVGNSVLAKENEYKLIMFDSARVSAVVSRLQRVKSLCG